MLRPLGAELLITEDGGVAECLEDEAEGRTVVDVGLGLDPDFVLRLGGVTAWVAGYGGFGLALVGEGPEVAVAPQAENLLRLAQGASGRVVESVLLEGARCVEVEAEAGETGL